jgi:hypothetical protein
VATKDTRKLPPAYKVRRSDAGIGFGFALALA